MITYCPTCNTDREATVYKREETYPVKGEPITIIADVVVCNVCGDTIYDDELDGKNLERAYADYRKKHGFLSPEDIKQIRAKYGLSQRGISALLGWSPTTIARYETGAIPSRPHNDQLIRFRDDPYYARKLYNENKDKLNRLEAKRVVEAFDSMGSSCHIARTMGDSLSRCYTNKDPVYVGNKVFDIDKLTNMVIFFVSEMKGVVKSKLLKLLWYADFLCYNRHGESISGTAYVHNYYGPIPEHHETLIAYLCEEGAIEIKPYDGPYEGECIVPAVEFDRELFSESELEVLEDVLEKFRNATAKDLTDYSHSEDGYKMTEMKQLIPYTYADSLRALH